MPATYAGAKITATYGADVKTVTTWPAGTRPTGVKAGAYSNAEGSTAARAAAAVKGIREHPVFRTADTLDVEITATVT